MKERPIDGERAVVAHDQAAEVAEPSEGAFHDPAPPVAPQRSAVLRRRLAPILAMRARSTRCRAAASRFRSGSLS